MNEKQTWEAAVALLRAIIKGLPERTAESIRTAISQAAESFLPIQGNTDLMEKLARHFEMLYDVKQKVGKIIHEEGYAPWLQAAHADQRVVPYYWTSCREYLHKDRELPPNVISTLDEDTDEILDHAGNPHSDKGWKKRGMVLGHVQSGKTTNYSALMCKAADAGYKVIVLLSGTSNMLRQQTQRRIDEAFIGRRAAFQPGMTAKIGAGFHRDEDTPRFPIYGTTVDGDFNSVAAQNYGVSIRGTKEPIVFVVKKNGAILANLRRWVLTEYPQGRISHPLLLIDDEADNASINTHKDPKQATRINDEIRQLLGLFDRSSYIGYTATPFANIFIEPDSEKDMLNHDLFPENFIKALDPPTNYVGAQDVFPKEDEHKERTSIVRILDDYWEIPLKHDKHLQIPNLPSSLMRAIRLFVLCRALLISQQAGDGHSTMMINVSRFRAVHAQVSNLTRDYLAKINNAARQHCGRASDTESNSHMADLKRDYEEEYGMHADWRSVREFLAEASGGIAVKTINSEGEPLDYQRHGNRGLHVIAVGGLALSRGLTLEGLCISYLIRNAGAYDTLMQMARWFGYRDDFTKNICRVFMPEVTRGRYNFVREATEELRGEIDSMNILDKTPAEFGLKVRRHDASVFQITARNRMRKAQTMAVANDLACRHMEARVIFADREINNKNYQLVRKFVGQIGECAPITDNAAHKNYPFWRGVDMKSVRKFLLSFELPPKNPWLSGWGASSSDNPVMSYMEERARELSQWDVCIPVKQEAANENPPISVNIAGRNFILRERMQGADLDEAFYKVMPTRVSDRLDAAIGISGDVVAQIDIPSDKTLNEKREKPLLLIHVVNAWYKEDKNGRKNPYGDIPAVTYSIFFPTSSVEAQERIYAVNRVYQWMKDTPYAIDQEDEDDE